jgi:hypothetical protein
MGAIAAGIIASAPGFGHYLLSGIPGSILGDMCEGAYVEEAREFLGLTMAMALLGAYVVRGPQKRY